MTVGMDSGIWFGHGEKKDRTALLQSIHDLSQPIVVSLIGYKLAEPMSSAAI